MSNKQGLFEKILKLKKEGKEEMNLSGKVAFVTGGAQRVGKILCLALARAGADIAMNYWHTEEDAQKTKSEIESLNRRCLALEGDITDIQQVNRMMAKIEKEFNRLDILVHNASNFNKCPFMEVTEEIWESSFGVNLKGPFFVSQAAAKLMLKNGSGRIIALVGNSYYENWPNYIPHTIAKTGLAKLMQSLAIALSPNIQCNAICPANIYLSESESDQSESLIKEKDAKFQEDYFNMDTSINFDASGIKIHKGGSAKEVAELVVYLSGCSNYLNGAVIPIDGGKYTI
jgi:NAD(P)-dependent dehydrogenase (short-subunit alcohol dehydrogenase family)